jgi:hypothetical protein
MKGLFLSIVAVISSFFGMRDQMPQPIVSTSTEDVKIVEQSSIQQHVHADQTSKNIQPTSTNVTLKTSVGQKPSLDISSTCLNDQSKKFGGEYVKGDILVTYKDTVAIDIAESILAKSSFSYSTTLVDSFPRLHTLVAIVPPGSEIASSCRLLVDPDVLYAGPNGITHADSGM